MCGIAGVFHYGSSEPVTHGMLKTMNDLLAHRGPDDEGAQVVGPVGLAMRRLAIIDLSGGHQPMSSPDGDLTIVFNGEIYNFLELRAELEKKGRRFQTRSDTEVILHLYELYGDDCVRDLRGMFAFALWDRKRERLLLARDRLGKKPLVFAEAGGRLAFASELRCLLTLPWVSRETDPRAIDLFLSLQYIPSPRTVFRHIAKVPPAHVLVCEKGRTTLKRYWDLPKAPSTLSLPEATEAVRAELTDSVRLRMIADVPLGAFLSGGIDSSIVVALMAQLSNRPVKTYSIGFEEQEFSELEYARVVAERYGTDHHELVVKADMAEVLPKIAWHYGEPYADTSALPSYFVSLETRRHVTVALNGDGGDEAFAGYKRYVAMQAGRAWDALPGPLRGAVAAGTELLPDGGNAPYGKGWLLKRFVRSMAHADVPARHLRMIGYFSEADKDGLYTDAFKARVGESTAPGGAALGYLQQAFARAQGLDFVNQLLFVDYMTYLPECLLVKMDIASMAASLEARSPFLDHKFVELAFSLPGSWKLRGLRTKWLLKEAFKDLLPAKIRHRGKQGFGSPVAGWFRGRLRKTWEDRVLGSAALSRGYFREAALRGMLEEHVSGRRDHGYRMFALLMLEYWHEQYAQDGRLAR